MARISTSSLLILSLLYIAGTAISVVVPPSQFIKSSCSATTYPALCIRDLSSYAATVKNNPAQLAQAALELSKARTQSTQAYLNKLKKFKGLHPIVVEAISDCLEEVSDSLDRLSKSAKEMKGIGRAKGESFTWHMSNIQTWVSSALTDENTCMDGFAGRAMDGKIKTSVRAHIINVAQVTSNALALLNNFAQKH